MHKTISIQGRVDICSFATLTRELEAEGIMVRSKSDIVWRAIEMLAGMYSRKHQTVGFTSIPDAIDYMDRIGIPLGTNSRVQKSIVQASADESFFLETGEDVGRVTTKKSILSSNDERAKYDLVAGVMRTQGIEPITFEQYMTGETEPIVKHEETFDESSFAQKEEEKLRKLKEAMTMKPSVAME
jgi:hypothetical protein